MKENKLVTPFLKWVGGKRQLLNEITNFLPKDIKRLQYHEPFIGGGAVFFALQPKNARINDFNEELINVYRVVRDSPSELIESLKKHKNSHDYYYSIREQDRMPLFSELSPIERASRIIYLNKTCYNGLFRVNNAGEFNVPYGKYKNPNIVNEPVIRATSKYLNTNQIEILHGDYAEALSDISSKSFVYLDPPYHPISDTSNFTGYIQGGWNADDQLRLRDVCIELDRKGVKFLLSNSSAQMIKDIYSNFNIEIVCASRAINCDANKRGNVEEVLIRNYE